MGFGGGGRGLGFWLGGVGGRGKGKKVMDREIESR